MVVYSFYSIEKNVKERLRDHVILLMKSITKESRLVRFGESFNKKFYKIINYSFIFHDFGKVLYNQYFFNKDRDLSFSGHEVISCWGANEYLKGLVEKEEITGIDRSIILLTILLHHHPMSLEERVVRLRGRFENIKINTETFDLFYEELKGMIEREPVNVNKDVSVISQEVCGREGLLKDLWIKVWMNSNPNIRKTFLLAIQALVSADYYSAHKIRGEESKFMDNVNTFIKFYMASPDTRDR